jgi:hypothetical protein
MTSWTRAERRWRDALLAAMIPARTGEQLPGFEDLDMGPFWDDVRRTAPPLLRFALRLAVWALTWLPLLVLGRPSSFGGLSRPDQDRMLRRVTASRSYLLRQLVQTVRVMACFAYFRAPEVRTYFAPNDHPEPEPSAPETPSP